MQQIPRLAYWAEQDVYNVTGNCQDLSDLPNISFLIGSETYSIPPSQWVSEVRPLLALAVHAQLHVQAMHSCNAWQAELPSNEPFQA